MLSDLISSELPYLRRYARGLMGEQQNGDEAVEDMIESLIFRISVAPDLKFQKADLFAELDKSISKRVSTLMAPFFKKYDTDGDNQISIDELRALLVDIGEPVTKAEAVQWMPSRASVIILTDRRLRTHRSNARSPMR